MSNFFQQWKDAVCCLEAKLEDLQLDYCGEDYDEYVFELVAIGMGYDFGESTMIISYLAYLLADWGW